MCYKSGQQANSKTNPCLPVDLAALADAVGGDGIGGLTKEYPIVADSQPEQPIKLTTERFDIAHPGCCVTVNGLQNLHSIALIDGANLSRHIGQESDFLHGILVAL